MAAAAKTSTLQRHMGLERRQSVRMPRPASSILLDVLTVVMGSAHLASAVVVDALQKSGKRALPDDAGELVVFAWAHVVEAVSSAMGAAPAASFMEKLRSALDGERHAPSQPARTHDSQQMDSGVRGRGDGLRVLIIDSDALARSVLARTLARAGMELLVADHAEEALSRSHELGRVHVVYCPLDRRGAAELLHLLERLPELGVVGRVKAGEESEELSAMLRQRRHLLVSTRPTTTEAASSILALARSIADDLALE